MHLVDLESCCLFNNACLFLVSVQAEMQTQRALWVNMKEDSLALPRPSKPRLPHPPVERVLPTANCQSRDDGIDNCIFSLRRKP